MYSHRTRDRPLAECFVLRLNNFPTIMLDKAFLIDIPSFCHPFQPNLIRVIGITEKIEKKNIKNSKISKLKKNQTKRKTQNCQQKTQF